jgi:hypothetical protein
VPSSSELEQAARNTVADSIRRPVAISFMIVLVFIASLPLYTVLLMTL